MKKIFYTGLLMLLTGPWCYSQGFGIGTTTPDPRAILELKSANQGLLLTRVTDTNAINGGGVAGLLIYSMVDNKYYVHNGSSWKQLSFCGVGSPGGSSPGGSSFLPGLTSGKVTLSGARPVPQAILELRSSNRGLLLPRVTDTNAITGRGIAGLLIYATKDNHVYLHNGTAWMQLCYGNGGTGGGTTGGIGSITNCPGTVSGTLAPGVAAGNVTITFNYTGGNGGSYATMSVASTGVTGLTATLAAGNLASGNGSLVFTVTGTPGGSGTAAFPITIGGQSCTMTIVVGVGAGSISSITNCPGTASGVFMQGIAGAGIIMLNYSGGNGGSYAAMSVPSTGVTGLTARLAAGSFANGSGSLAFAIIGTPAGSGTAFFPITIGGQTCILQFVVAIPLPTVSGFTNCPGAASGSLTQGAAGTVTVTLNYNGGNGGSYGVMSVASTGVTGLTARLAAGNFANGSGSLVFSISGTPSAGGTASFPIIVGGQSCTLQGGASPSATIFTWYALTGGSWKVVYSGAGTRYAIFAPSSIPGLGAGALVTCYVTPVTAGGVKGSIGIPPRPVELVY